MMSPSVSRFSSPLHSDKRGASNRRDVAGPAGGDGDGDGNDNGNGLNDLGPSAPNGTIITTTMTTITTATTSTSITPISAAISEALRNNPFGSTSRSRALEAEAQAASREPDARSADLDDLNRSLVVLADLFPDVRIEVFRELLMRFDGKSRLHVCVEQLMRYKKQWVQGRWNIPVDDKVDNTIETGQGRVVAGSSANTVAPEELFRSETYRLAVRSVMCKEFNGLSRSTIEAVLAEYNFSYTRARPTLKELSRKGWRATIRGLNPFRRRKDDKDDNPLVTWERFREGSIVGGGDGGSIVLLPRLKQKTGSDELDQELHQTLIAPRLRDQRESQEYQDYRLATELNQKEATAENCLYECQCCLDDVTFEQVAVCSSETHIICFSCIQRTLHEAIFGQGWDNSVDPEKSTLKCVAPVSHGICEGHLDPMLVKRAVVSEKAGFETYRKFEERVASEALLKSKLKLVHCSSCSYAEIDPVFHPSTRTRATGRKGTGGFLWRFRRGNLFSMILTTILILDLIPLLIFPVLILGLLYPQTAAAIFRVSLQNQCLRARSPRFTCKNPSCRQVSCMTCHKIWRDPHTCEEPLQQSLRTTIEAARTAAVKRTCPRCNLSFVKSSGCNKLTCVCGYSMCYICRKALNGPSSRRLQGGGGGGGGGAAAANGGPRRPFLAGVPGEDDHNAADAEEGESGYNHFCEHFRVNPGTRCTECNKCELYFAEDEEAIARKAGEKAEREWRLRQSLIATTDNKTNDISKHQYQHPYLQKSTTNNKQSSPSNVTVTPGLDIVPAPVGKLQQQEDFIDPYRITTPYNHHNGSWQYWLIEVWKEDRWKWEIQGLVDKLVERLVVVDDIT